MSYTKGNWKPCRWWQYGDEKDNWEQYGFDTLAEAMQEPIKSIQDEKGYCVISCHDLATIDEADAKLIASAPLLLEACKEIKMAVNANKNDLNNIPIEFVMDIINNAIKSAEA